MELDFIQIKMSGYSCFFGNIIWKYYFEYYFTDLLNRNKYFDSVCLDGSVDGLIYLLLRRRCRLKWL